MKPSFYRLLAVLLTAFPGTAVALAAAEIPGVVNLWPAAAPGSDKMTVTEQVTERSKDPARHDRMYTHVVTPSLDAHRAEHPNGVSAVIAPGGGYQHISIDTEGLDTAAWLNGLGITAFVLKYRLPVDGHRNANDVALQDAQRAVRVVRAHAAEWGLDPARVGFIGYSAGGNLAAAVEFYFDRKVYAPVDSADQLGAQPDFCVLGYAGAGSGEPRSGPAGLPAQRRIRWDYRIEATPGVRYPPTFILQADDDPMVDPREAVTIFLELRQNTTPTEMHVFKSGGHGFGIRNARGPIAQWPALCGDWMREIGVIH
jgi:acetyl esterase/lipase